MKTEQEPYSYFSEIKILRRKQRREQRNLGYRLHILLTFLGSLLLSHQVLANSNTFYLRNGIYVQDTAILLQLVLYLPVLWLLVLIHLFWKRSREKVEAEIDAQMREARHYQQRDNTLDYDPAYRLSDDGELFYDEDEIEEYELKPKRRHDS